MTLVTEGLRIYATATTSFTRLPQLQLKMVWSCCRLATEEEKGWGELWQWFWQWRWHFPSIYSRLGCKVFHSKIWINTSQSISKQSVLLGVFKGFLAECPLVTTNSTANYHSDARLPASWSASVSTLTSFWQKSVSTYFHVLFLSQKLPQNMILNKGTDQ